MDSAGQTDHPSNSLTTVTSTTTTSISLSTTDQTQNVSSLALPFGTDHSQPLTIQTSQQAVSVHPVISPNGKATMQTEQITWQQLMTLVGPSLVDAKQQGQQQQLFDGQPVTIMNLDNESGLAHPPLVPKSQEQQQSATTLTPELIIAGNTCQLQPQKQTPIILASAPAAQPQQIYFPENSNLANCQVVCGSAPQQIDTLQGGAVQNFNGLNTGGGQQLLILLTPNTVATTSNFVQQHQFQSDPYDTSKWQLIPLEMAPASATGTSQIITTSFTSPTSVSRVVMPSTSGNKQVQIGKNAVKRRQKRVACSCPICKENEGLPKQEKKKKHMCHLPGCSKTYVAVSHLRAHLRWHADDRPFECDHPACTQSFIRSDTLRRHKRIHSACPRGNPAYTPGGTAKGPVVTRCSSNSPCANSQFHCVEGITEYGICCATKGGVASNTLEGSPDPGDVSYETKNVSRYYYASGQCLPFVYFGIGGNFNNFHTEDECRQFCSPKECTVGDPCWTHLAMRSGAQLGALPNTLVSPASAVHQQFDFSFACYLRSSGYIQTLKTFLTESPHLNGKNVEDFITPNHQVTPAPDRDLLDEAMKLSGIPTDWEKRGSERKKYLCNVPGCTKSYVRNSHLKAHLRGHAGETPFVCDYPSCSKRFTRSDVLQRHKRTHVQFPKSVGTFRSNESDTVKAPLHAATVILQDQQLNRNANGADANRQMYQNVPADPPPTGSSTLPNEPAINDQHRVINVPSMSSVVISPNGHYSPHSGEFHPPTSSYATL